MQDLGKRASVSQRHRIARRLKTLREERGLTQGALAERMGLPHRQTLTSIEAGSRSVSPEDLAKAAESLNVDMGVFTDPFRLVGEGRFSFRADGVPMDALRAFEDRAGQWVATYRTLQEQAGVSRSRLGRRLDLDRGSSYEDAHAAAEELRQEWQLGDVPATMLPAAIERELGAQVLFVEAPAGVSGAAVHLPGLLTILVNRREPTGRRNFDLAHELFHLLTWDSMPPDRVESREVPGKKGNRVEKLAENFAGALLMPADMVGPQWEQRRGVDLCDWLNSTASAFGVTSLALKWRLVVLGHLSRARARGLDDSRLAGNGGLESRTTPLLFSRDFVVRVLTEGDATPRPLRSGVRRFVPRVWPRSIVRGLRGRGVEGEEGRPGPHRHECHHRGRPHRVLVGHHGPASGGDG
jgi:Zn-dependent peptidase ImmA (M78 family)/DNA-binding XRE family transcriptional regulator